MKSNQERYNELIDKIYVAKDPSAILEAFKNAITNLPSLNECDELKFTIFHHFCAISKRLKGDKKIIKGILSLILKPNSKISKTMKLFSDPIPSEDSKLKIKVR